jgi:hypothetical protein
LSGIPDDRPRPARIALPRLTERLDRAVDRFAISQSDYTWMALTERLERNRITAREVAA